jgi:hypothetical protein
MRHLILTVSLLLIAGSLGAQQGPAQSRSEQVPGWVPVKRVCGRVRIIERGVFVPAPKKELQLYEAKWRKPCCKDLKMAVTRTTSENGDFDFGDIRSGRYWLTVELDGVQHGIAIDVDERHDWDSCEAQGPDISKNAVNWRSGTPIM